MLTRQRFGAFDREVWTIQWILDQLGFAPGPIDGLWGSQTFGAVAQFRDEYGLGPASDITKAGAADSAFMTALWGASFEADLDVPVAPGSGSSGGTSTRPVSIPTGQQLPAARPPSPSAAPGIDFTAILALGAVGIGAVLLARRRR